MALGISFRKRAVWLLLAAMLAPGLAGARAACCAPEMTKKAACCASSMQMPGMDSSQAATDVVPILVAGSLCSRAVACGPTPEADLLGLIVRSSLRRDERPSQAPNDHPSLAWSARVEVSPQASSVLLVEGRPPRLFPADAFVLVLRI